MRPADTARVLTERCQLAQTANVSLRECGWPECLRADVQGDPFCLLQCMSPEVALFGPKAVSDLSPLCDVKRTWQNTQRVCFLTSDNQTLPKA
jgi:hypothetical protein